MPLSAFGSGDEGSTHSHVARTLCDTGGVLDEVTLARELIRIVSSDSGLPRSARSRAASLQALATSQPSLVFDDLETLRRQAIPALPLHPPTCDYARCVSVEAFWLHNLRAERRAAFLTPRNYLHWLRFQGDPAAAALAVPARHVQWSPGDVPDERIDQDIPYAALGGVEWRP